MVTFQFFFVTSTLTETVKHLWAFFDCQINVFISAGIVNWKCIQLQTLISPPPHITISCHMVTNTLHTKYFLNISFKIYQSFSVEIITGSNLFSSTCYILFSYYGLLV